MEREIRTHCYEEDGYTVCKTLDCLGVCFKTSPEGMGVEVCSHYTVRLPGPDWVEPCHQMEICDK